jgi:PleD family two-component response regulator
MILGGIRAGWNGEQLRRAGTSAAAVMAHAYAPNQWVDSVGVSVARPTRVLVIGDDPSMQHMIMNYLEQQNMRVIAASQRQEAIRQFTASEPDVVILDLQLDQEDGIDLLRAGGA